MTTESEFDKCPRCGDDTFFMTSKGPKCRKCGGDIKL